MSESDNYVIPNNRIVGGNGLDEAHGSCTDPDGSILLVGKAESIDFDFSTAGALTGGAAVKIGSDFKLLWSKKYAICKNGTIECVIKTIDGGYLMAGSTISDQLPNGNPTNTPWDGFVIKTDASGNEQWSRLCGGSGDDGLYWILPTSDNNYIIIGDSESMDGDLINSHSEDEGWIIKLDGNGNKLWSRQYGGSNRDVLQSGINTPDGGYLLIGFTSSSDGDVIKSSDTNIDGWVLKVDKDGQLLWNKTYGGKDDDYTVTGIAGNEGHNYIISGFSYSKEDIFSTNHGIDDAWIFKIDESGNVQWNKLFGGSSFDYIFSICKTSDNKGYMLAGGTGSNDGDLIDAFNHNPGSYTTDIWLLKTDENGNKKMGRCFGGSENDDISLITNLSNGSYYITGSSISWDGDLINKGSHRDSEMWLFKLQAK